jgi:hypothetical protein
MFGMGVTTMFFLISVMVSLAVIVTKVSASWSRVEVEREVTRRAQAEIEARQAEVSAGLVRGWQAPQADQV